MSYKRSDSILNPKSILSPWVWTSHTRWDDVSPCTTTTSDDGKRGFLSVHVLQSKILLVLWQGKVGTQRSIKSYTPIGRQRLSLWALLCDFMEQQQAAGGWWDRVEESGHIWAETNCCCLTVIAWLDHFLSPFLSLCISHTQLYSFFPPCLSVTPLATSDPLNLDQLNLIRHIHLPVSASQTACLCFQNDCFGRTDIYLCICMFVCLCREVQKGGGAVRIIDGELAACLIPGISD